MDVIQAPPPPNFDYPVSTSEDLHGVPEYTRRFFYWLIVTISVVAIIGNILAIRYIITRKTKFLQKICISALSLSDILNVLLYASVELDTLSNQLVTWCLGEFMCYFIPTAQVFTTLVSASTLMVIAIDRYRSCMKKFSKFLWNPKPLTCVLLVGSLLIVCVGISYPMYLAFNYTLLWVLVIPHTTEKAVYQLRSYCYGTNYKLRLYYLALDILIFAPLLLMCTWFYIQIGILICKQRKSVSSNITNLENKQSEESATNPTKTTNHTSAKNNVKSSKIKNVQTRRIRTFRIILALIVSFICCRFPYWCFYTLRLVIVRNDATTWNIHFSFVALKLLNCVLNPLLDTFSIQTFATLKMVREFLWKICCCCFSTDEFEEFDSNNSFAKDQVNPSCGTVMTRPNLRQVHFEGRNEIQRF